MTDCTERIIRGFKVPVFTRGPAPKGVPSWLDKEKFRRGQKFAQDHALGTALGEMMCLILLFAFPDSMQALIFSERTDTNDKAKIRYISTLNRLLHWYTGDVWSESTARRHIEVVRSMHAAVQEKLLKLPIGSLPSKTTLINKFIPQSSTPIVGKGLFHEDLKRSVKAPKANTIPSVKYGQETFCPINQGEMLMTQFTFVGLIIQYPEKFGACNASDEDLEAFIHMWRGIVYLVGIEDEYNFCAGDLATIKTQSKQILDQWLKPSLLTCSQEWEYMSRCMLAPFNGVVDLETLVFYTCSTVMGIPLPRFLASLGWRGRLKITFLDFILTKVLRIPLFRSAFNWFLQKVLLGSQNTYENGNCPYG